MPGSYIKLYYHIVWSTKHRYQGINSDIEAMLYDFIKSKIVAYGCKLHAIGGIEDHIHIVVEMSPSINIAEFIGKIKGSSSHYLNKEISITKDFKWQAGYAALTISENNLFSIVNYVKKQKQHHLENNLNASIEDFPLDD